ncbi:MAG: DinB family protein [Anaerolineales bacterium]|nr:DinB family protein [Anaerolineales bacterium]MCB8959308.1 DinB family protein [Ardenticatenales bacterium]
MLDQTRQLIHRATADLSAEAWFTVPAGYANNIAWNLGHILVVQQMLLYRLSGNEMRLLEGQYASFRPGSSPADWHANPDTEALREQLLAQASLFAADLDAGCFGATQPYTTSTGVTLLTFQDCYEFNLFHEGLHLGHILSLRGHFA